VLRLGSAQVVRSQEPVVSRLGKPSHSSGWVGRWNDRRRWVGRLVLRSRGAPRRSGIDVYCRALECGGLPPLSLACHRAGAYNTSDGPHGDRSPLAAGQTAPGRKRKGAIEYCVAGTLVERTRPDMPGDTHCSIGKPYEKIMLGAGDMPGMLSCRLWVATAASSAGPVCALPPGHMVDVGRQSGADLSRAGSSTAAGTGPALAPPDHRSRRND